MGGVRFDAKCGCANRHVFTIFILPVIHCLVEIFLHVVESVDALTLSGDAECIAVQTLIPFGAIIHMSFRNFFVLSFWLGESAIIKRASCFFVEFEPSVFLEEFEGFVFLPGGEESVGAPGHVRRMSFANVLEYRSLSDLLIVRQPKLVSGGVVDGSNFLPGRIETHIPGPLASGPESPRVFFAEKVLTARFIGN